MRAVNDTLECLTCLVVVVFFVLTYNNLAVQLSLNWIKLNCEALEDSNSLLVRSDSYSIDISLLVLSEVLYLFSIGIKCYGKLFNNKSGYIFTK